MDAGDWIHERFCFLMKPDFACHENGGNLTPYAPMNACQPTQTQTANYPCTRNSPCSSVRWSLSESRYLMHKDPIRTNIISLSPNLPTKQEKLTITVPMQKIETFNAVSNLFFIFLLYFPRFIYSQNTPLNPYVYQLANNELMSPKRSLKTGIASAMIHATVQSDRTIIAQ